MSGSSSTTTITFCSSDKIAPERMLKNGSRRVHIFGCRRPVGRRAARRITPPQRRLVFMRQRFALSRQRRFGNSENCPLAAEASDREVGQPKLLISWNRGTPPGPTTYSYK